MGQSSDHSGASYNTKHGTFRRNSGKCCRVYAILRWSVRELHHDQVFISWSYVITCDCKSVIWVVWWAMQWKMITNFYLIIARLDHIYSVANAGFPQSTLTWLESQADRNWSKKWREDEGMEGGRERRGGKWSKRKIRREE